MTSKEFNAWLEQSNQYIRYRLMKVCLINKFNQLSLFKKHLSELGIEYDSFIKNRIAEMVTSDFGEQAPQVISDIFSLVEKYETLYETNKTTAYSTVMADLYAARAEDEKIFRREVYETELAEIRAAQAQDAISEPPAVTSG